MKLLKVYRFCYKIVNSFCTKIIKIGIKILSKIMFEDNFL